MDMDNMMNEMGGAFMVAWLVSDMGSLEGALVLAAAWMAISGAHILPVITWGHIMTGDLGDTDAWMDNGSRLVAQVVGGALALMMTGTFGEFAASEVATSGFDIVTGDVVTAIAAGALMWTVYDRCDAWVAAFAIMAMVTAGGLDVTGASDMAGQMLGGGAEGVDVNTMDAIVDWVMSGLWVGVGALVATKIPDMV
ncbi:MAG: hypothetical protein QF760_04765 [Candidatus Thalassarchaeaceae archaeon]|jgi:hypothetical protein|nr:hypothetical protein [Candidatus Thalassarchaeaceae archaeon]